VLEPTYIKIAPANDGWNHPVQYQSGAAGVDYTVRSPGKNLTLDVSSGQTNNFNCDIIFQDGQFTAWPQGIQT